MKTTAILLGALALFAPRALSDVSDTCSATNNSTGVPATLSWTGPHSPKGGGLLAIHCPPRQPAVILYGLQEQATPFGDGSLCVGPPAWFMARLRTDATGRVDFDIRTQAEREDWHWLNYNYGATWYFQMAFRDLVSSGAGFNLTNGLQVLFD